MIRKGLVGGTYKPLGEDEIAQIHDTAMRVFEEVGIQVNSGKALRYFKEAGAKIEGPIVKMPRDMVMGLVAKAPPNVTLYGQKAEHNLKLGGARVYAGTGGTALNIIDGITGDRRRADLRDLKDIAKLVDHLDNIHFFLLPTYPSDVPAENVDVNRFFAGLDNTSKHIMGGVYTHEGMERVLHMAELIAGSSKSLRQKPIISLILCAISPLKIDELYGDMIVTIAKAGIPVALPSEPLCGSTSPVTIAGNVVVQTVDSLAEVCLTQLVNPGAPAIFGSVASSNDFRDLKYITGAIEMGLSNAASAQMAQFYKLPFYATGGMSDAKVVDAQCGYESALTLLLCALSGANYIHDAAGLMDFALSVSPEKYVVDDEIIGMAMRAVSGIPVNKDTLAFDLIKEVGPGGHFIHAKHTRKYMRTNHYQPSLSDREHWENWQKDGKSDTAGRAREKVQKIMAGNGHRLPEDIRQRIISEIPEIID
ncbi:MAG: trimethylamine methyltransferase family protein [Dehalococcoidia bacterium]|nr:trimethylamine methyltransferase family protein [Dehalococcoidia bacterium]